MSLLLGSQVLVIMRCRLLQFDENTSQITVIIERLKVTSMTTESLGKTCRPIYAISRSL